MRLELSTAAECDLRAIFEWTDRNFGLTQAARYNRALNERIRAIVVKPTLGRPVMKARAGTRRVSAGRHFIYFRIEGDAVRIVRILHQRMLQTAHLD